MVRLEDIPDIACEQALIVEARAKPSANEATCFARRPIPRDFAHDATHKSCSQAIRDAAIFFIVTLLLKKKDCVLVVLNT